MPVFTQVAFLDWHKPTCHKTGSGQYLMGSIMFGLLLTIRVSSIRLSFVMA
jgi:hypothetical protein